MLRPRKVTAPNGAWTKTTYHDNITSCTPGTDSCLYVKMQTLMDTGRVTESYTFFDQLGRAIRSQSSLGSAGYLTVDTQFDSYGRAYRTSNPYTATALNGSVNPSGVWTTITGYDALSRVTQVTLPDSTTVGTSYSGIYTTVTDQAGRSRRQKVDAFGRIVRVDEADPDPAHPGDLGSVDSPYMASYYTYDTLGNLIKIQQGQGTDLQYRYFKYDALSRLTYERQPEADGTFTQSDTGLTGNSYWSRKLVYDETISGVSYQGLLTKMCDAREICSQTKYDQLNRPWEVSYPGTRQPTVTTHYDLGYDEDHHATKGKVTEILTSEVSNSTSTSWDDDIPATSLTYTFDQWGRMVASSQIITSAEDSYSYTHDFKYQYNLGGQMTQEEYPSHRIVNFGYDDASRLSNVNSGAGHVYVDGFTYTGQGLVSGYTLGNGATVSLGYGTNGRLQLSEIILAKNGTTLQKYQYSYGQIESGSVNTAKNNGQLAQVDSWIGTTQEYRQQFKYDCLNRLLNSKETYGTSLGSTAYDIKYRYDTFGNREQRSADNSGNTTITQKWVESGDYDIANNRFISTGSTPVAYDAAGNITSDAKFRNMLFGYDANGRQNYSAQLNGSSPVTVIFDGAGQKVATKSGDYLSVSVYDAGGKLAAEYSQYGAPTTANVDYITPNYQGSTSVVTDNAGTVKSRHDYLPFGEEIGDGVGSRTTAKKFGQSDNVRQKYAGMETDDATGLNHTLWRKDDNWSGRWTSRDPYGGSMSTGDPQSFNRYAYCSNDPVNHVDPSGLVPSGYHDATQGWDQVGGYLWDPTGIGRRINRNFSSGANNNMRAQYVSDERAAFSFQVAAFLRENADADPAELDGTILRRDSTGFHVFSTSVTGYGIESPATQEDANQVLRGSELRPSQNSFDVPGSPDAQLVVTTRGIGLPQQNYDSATDTTTWTVGGEFTLEAMITGFGPPWIFVPLRQTGYVRFGGSSIFFFTDSNGKFQFNVIVARVPGRHTGLEPNLDSINNGKINIWFKGGANEFNVGFAIGIHSYDKDPHVNPKQFWQNSPFMRLQ